MKIITMRLGEMGANCYLVIDGATKEAMVIDPGEWNEKLKNTIEAEQADVRYIALTHGHYDHIGGVKGLQDDTGAKTAIHEKDAVCLENDAYNLSDKAGMQVPHAKADIRLKDGDTIKIGKTEFEVFYTPGHSKGSVCYICEKEKVMFSGDTLFCKTIGRTDLPGGDPEEMMLSLYRIHALHGNYTVYPGHNRATSLDAERKTNRYLRKLN